MQQVMRSLPALLLVACVLAVPAIAARQPLQFTPGAFFRGVSDGLKASEGDKAVTAMDGPKPRDTTVEVTVDNNLNCNGGDCDNNGDCNGDDCNNDDNNGDCNGDGCNAEDVVDDVFDNINDVVDRFNDITVTGAKAAGVLKKFLPHFTPIEDTKDDECDDCEHKKVYTDVIHVVHVDDKEEDDTEDDPPVKDLKFHYLLAQKVQDAIDTLLYTASGAVDMAQTLKDYEDIKKGLKKKVEEKEEENGEEEDKKTVIVEVTPEQAKVLAGGNGDKEKVLEGATVVEAKAP